MTTLASLLVIYAVLAVLFMSLFWVADRADARRRRSNPIVMAAPQLPACIAIPTNHRRQYPERWS